MEADMAKKSKGTDGIEWKEPPPKSVRKSFRHDALRDTLRERPKQWALIHKAKMEKSRQLAHSIAQRYRGSMAWAGFEILARGREVYARYVGERAGRR